MQKEEIISKKKISRRQFIGGAATAAAAFTIVPSYVLGQNRQTPPSEKLNIAGIGAGGMGANNIRVCSETENIVALCDVDDKQAAETYKKFPQVPKYRDFREMLEKEEKNIDAVIVATPDHTHAVAAMMAIKMKKHVYVQKPLTWSVKEARMLTEAARQAQVATQMGNQGHSGEGIRLVCEWIWDGAIGPVRQVHAWTNRPVWPQGIDRPQETPAVPETLNWDLWLGPAPQRPYNPCYLPFNWRAWLDFGTGALGDMACHIVDPAFWALKLKYPVSVQGCSARFVRKMWDKEPNNETYPQASIVRYKFPARDDMPPVDLTWYDGGMMPPLPEDLPANRRLGDEDGGVLFVGDKGKLSCGCYGKSPVLMPEELRRDYPQPPKTIPRIPGGLDGHEKDWIRACKGGTPASSNFEYSGPLTETVVMGNLALRTGRKIVWDGANMKAIDDDEANQLVQRSYRQGWTL